MLDTIFHTYVGRTVAVVLTPFLTVLTGGLVVWVDKHLGLTLDGGQLTGFIVASVTGVAIVIYKWLSNLGIFEAGLAELEKLHELGAPE